MFGLLSRDRGHRGFTGHLQNGLTQPSQITVDKPQTPGRARVGPVIGHLDDVTLLAVDRALAVFLGLAELAHHPCCTQ